MRKLIGTIVVILLIVVGFTGVNLKVNGTAFKIPPYIKNVLNDKKKVFNEAKDKLTDEVKDEK